MSVSGGNKVSLPPRKKNKQNTERNKNNEREIHR